VEPTGVDIRSAFGVVRDQGRRPTCLAFAASAAHEHARSSNDSLSVEALFQNSKRRDGLAVNVGTTMSASMIALEDAGQCDETAWPYGSAVAIDASAIYHRARPDMRRKDDLVATVRSTLANNRGALLVLTMTDAWYTVAKNGIIRPPASNDVLLGSHAVVVAGYDDGDGRFIIRNSWGRGWGDDGYGLVPYGYVDRYGLEVATLSTVA